MRNLRRRVEMLERRLLKRRSPNLLEFQIAALEHWSPEDLQLLADAATARDEGRALAEVESAILGAFNSAMLQACRRDGFGSLEECSEWYRKRSARWMPAGAP
jgi:hypothetical protein